MRNVSWGNRVRISSCKILAVLLVASFCFAQQKRPITEKDLFQFQWIGDSQLSPDGSQVAFVRVKVNDKKDGYDTAIWTVATDGKSEPVRLTSGKHDASPRWSPDGKLIVFLRGGDPPKEGAKPPASQLALLSLSGGEAISVTDMPRSVSDPVWSPDGKRIAFLCDANPEDFAKKQKQESGEAEHESDVKVITRAEYRFNGIGYLDPKHHKHLWIMDVPSGSDARSTPKQLAKGDFDEQEPSFLPDGSRIVFHADRDVEPYYNLPQSDVLTVPANGGPVELIAKVKLGGLLGGISSMVLSPDGKRIAFVAAAEDPVRSYSQPDLYTLALEPGATPKNLTADYDFDVNSGVGGDNSAPRGGGHLAPVWSKDGSHLLDVVAKHGRAILAKFDVTGKAAPQELSRGDQAVEDFQASSDGKLIVEKISTPTMIDELFLLQPDGSQRQITNINGALFNQLSLTQPEEIWYTSFDGKKIQAWAQKPPDFDPKKKYPLILDIHGGPHGAYGWIFDHEFQWMAAKGYVVLYPNPRGSTSYGQEFGNIIQYKYPGDDFKDLMAGVDELVKRGYIDPNKLGVTGGSGGGLLTDWTVGHTNRFRAAVAQRDISDWAAWWYTADFTLFQPNWFKAPPFDDPKDFVDRSPITYIKNVKTPMMFILGEADYRTPPSAGGEQMFRALRFMHEPAVMVRFPGESHELSRSGQPWHRIERLEHIVGFFDMYLMGVDHPEYHMPSDQVSSKPKTEKPEEQPNSPQ